ncbi:hypothetical protein XCR_2954 [Xanthomonas campestris pv. raphani 756C]|nr:hypothetical protein XCR_2954 [Xanthomonas campestris pv. raphani 756C]
MSARRSGGEIEHPPSIPVGRPCTLACRAIAAHDRLTAYSSVPQHAARTDKETPCVPPSSRCCWPCPSLPEPP